MLQKKSWPTYNPAQSANEHITQLHDTLMSHYGTDWLEWLPETLWQTLYADNIAPEEGFSRLDKDQMQAIRICLTTNRPWVEYEVFEFVGQTFSGHVGEVVQVDPLTPELALQTLHILSKIRPTEQFGNEVISYCASIFAHGGLIAVGPLVNPTMAEAAQATLEELIVPAYVTKADMDLVQKACVNILANNTELDHSSLSDTDVIHVQIRKLLEVYKHG